MACGLTDSQEALEDGLSDIASSGGTDFNAAIKAAITLFDENDTLPITKRIILLSDGIDTVSYDVEMYDSIIKNVEKDEYYQNIIFYDDATYTIWIMWGE